MTARCLYAILHHEGIPRPHFDLMFQTAPGSKLATWRADVWPLAEKISVEKIGDHRIEYLTFEGKLTGDRGEVRRVEQGICESNSLGNDEWRFQIRSIPQGVELILEFKKQADETWQCLPIRPAGADSV